jgi:RNA polymerase sigma-70 factor (ECF subfamily)
MDSGDNAGDAVLVAAMAAGDRAALATLYRRYGGLMLSIAMRIVGERNQAEDLLHDVFLEAWRSAKDFDPQRGSVRTWLAIRVRSRSLDVRKSARVSRNAGDTGLDALSSNAPLPSPDHERVRAALAGLSSEQRRVVELAYFEGLSCSEIAARLSVPIGTVKSRLAAGLRRLREALGGGI